MWSHGDVVSMKTTLLGEKNTEFGFRTYTLSHPSNFRAPEGIVRPSKSTPESQPNLQADAGRSFSADGFGAGSRKWGTSRDPHPSCGLGEGRGRYVLPRAQTSYLLRFGMIGPCWHTPQTPSQKVLEITNDSLAHGFEELGVGKE